MEKNITGFLTIANPNTSYNKVVMFFKYQNLFIVILITSFFQNANAVFQDQLKPQLPKACLEVREIRTELFAASSEKKRTVGDSGFLEFDLSENIKFNSKEDLENKLYIKTSECLSQIQRNSAKNTTHLNSVSQKTSIEYIICDDLIKTITQIMDYHPIASLGVSENFSRSTPILEAQKYSQIDPMLSCENGQTIAEYFSSIKQEYLNKSLLSEDPNLAQSTKPSELNAQGHNLPKGSIANQSGIEQETLCVFAELSASIQRSNAQVKNHTAICGSTRAKAIEVDGRIQINLFKGQEFTPFKSQTLKKSDLLKGGRGAN